MVGFIDAHRDAHWVEPIRAVLPIAPSTYYEHLAKRADPALLSDRARPDEALRPEILRVCEENWRVYGVRKIWRQLGREGFEVVNPAEINPDAELDWHSCMRADIKALCDCDAIALLPGWMNSKGAHLELQIAHRLGLRIGTIKEFLL